MSEQVPQIGPIEKLYALYDAYLQAQATIGEPVRSGGRIVKPANELVSGLEPLVSNSSAYIVLAGGLYEIRSNLRSFQENLECALSDSRKLRDKAPPTTEDLKSILFQDVNTINESLASVSDGEAYLGLRAAVMRFNNTIENCFTEEDIMKVKFEAQHLLGSISEVRKMMFPSFGETSFPTIPSYEERDRFGGNVIAYVDSLKELSAFAKGKEKVGFRYTGMIPYTGADPRVFDFKDKTPRKHRREGSHG